MSIRLPVEQWIDEQKAFSWNFYFPIVEQIKKYLNFVLYSPKANIIDLDERPAFFYFLAGIRHFLGQGLVGERYNKRKI